MFGNNIKIDDDLLRRARECAASEGYATVEEFVTHVLEKEIARIAGDRQGGEEQVADRLRGLGYIE
jgi:hypothetical protein